MTREEIAKLNGAEPFCFETDREQQWYECGLVQGAEIAEEAMLEKACEWIRKTIILDDNEDCELEWYVPFDNPDEMINDFRKAMEG